MMLKEKICNSALRKYHWMTPYTRFLFILVIDKNAKQGRVKDKEPPTRNLPLRGHQAIHQRCMCSSKSDSTQIAIHRLLIAPSGPLDIMMYLVKYFADFVIPNELMGWGNHHQSLTTTYKKRTIQAFCASWRIHTTTCAEGRQPFSSCLSAPSPLPFLLWDAGASSLGNTPLLCSSALAPRNVKGRLEGRKMEKRLTTSCWLAGFWPFIMSPQQKQLGGGQGEVWAPALQF